MAHSCLALALVASGIACFTDLHTRTIPNWLTLPLPLCALALHVAEDGLLGALLCTAGALACFLPVYFLFARGALGGGDVKLLAGTGALLGPREGLEAELSAFALIALFALVRTALHGGLWRLVRASWSASLHLLAPARFAAPEGEGLELPLGLAIFVAIFALGLRSLF